MSLLGLSMMSVAARGATAVVAAATPTYASWPPLPGAEMMVNGDCSSGTGWTLPAGSAIAVGKLTLTAFTNTVVNSGVPFSAFIDGATYRTLETVDTVSLGAIQIVIGEALGTSRTTTGTFSQDLIAVNTAGSEIGWQLNGTSATMQLDNFSVKSIGLMGVEADWAFTGGANWGGNAPGIGFDESISDSATLIGSAATAFNAAVSSSTATSSTFTPDTLSPAYGRWRVSFKGGATALIVFDGSGAPVTIAVTSGSGSGCAFTSDDGSAGGYIGRVQITLA